MEIHLITLPYERIENRIFLVRNKRVMLDSDLAQLYGVETKVLNQAVRRNKKRFPPDFMFVLNKRETQTCESRFNLRSQIVTSSWGGKRYSAYAFTEQGVAMLSSVLNSKRAIQVNIQIMRTFIRLREMLATNKKLREKIEKLEKKYDNQFRVVFDMIKKLIVIQEKPRKPIGFKLP